MAAGNLNPFGAWGTLQPPTTPGQSMPIMKMPFSLRVTSCGPVWDYDSLGRPEPKLHAAIRAILTAPLGGTKHVLQLLDDGAVDVNECDASCQTALHLAAYYNDVQLVRLLLDRGAAVHAVDERTKTPLHTAVLSHSAIFGTCAEVIRQLLQAGADVHCSTRDWGRTTVLHLAAQKGAVGAVRALLAAGVSPNVLDQRRQTPLFLAAAASNTATVEALVRAGADVSAGGPACQCRGCKWHGQLCWDNKDKLVPAPEMQEQNTEAVLHAANVAPIPPADADAAADMVAAAPVAAEAMPPHAAAGASAAASQSPAHIAAAEPQAAAEGPPAHSTDMDTTPVPEAAAPAAGHLAQQPAASVQSKPASDCYVDAQDRIGNTALHYAAALGRTHTLEALLAAGAAVNAVNHEGCTPLHMAVSGPCCCTPACSATVQLLLAAGADVTLPDVRGRAALHLSAMLVDLGALQQLLAAGADANAATHDRETPLLLVGCGPGRPDPYMLLPAESMLLAAEGEHPAAHTWQCQHVFSAHSHSVERVAACIQCLLSAGARPSTVALHKAASKGWEAAVKLLLAAGIDKDAPDLFRDTALHKAACSDACPDAQLAVMQVLLAAGADVSAQNVSGFTPLHAACGQAKPEAVQLLLASGADVAATAGPYRETALHTALKLASDVQYSSRHVQVVQMLLNAGADVKAKLDGFPVQEIPTGLQPLHLALDPHNTHRGQRTTPQLTNDSLEFVVQIMQHILAAGASVDDADPIGRTAVSMAVSLVARPNNSPAGHTCCQGCHRHAQPCELWLVAERAVTRRLLRISFCRSGGRAAGLCTAARGGAHSRRGASTAQNLLRAAPLATAAYNGRPLLIPHLQAARGAPTGTGDHQAVPDWAAILCSSSVASENLGRCLKCRHAARCTGDTRAGVGCYVGCCDESATAAGQSTGWQVLLLADQNLACLNTFNVCGSCQSAWM